MAERTTRFGKRRPLPDDGGFGVLEFLIALIVLLVISSAFFGVLRSTAVSLEASSGQHRAVIVARNIIEMARADPEWAKTDPSGMAGENLRWRLLATPYRETSGDDGGGEPHRVALHAVSVTIDDGDKPLFVLSSLIAEAR